MAKIKPIQFGEVPVEKIRTLFHNPKCGSATFFKKRVSVKSCILQIIFEQGLCCVGCGLEVNRFVVQQHDKEHQEGNKKAHLAPYHDTRLFTKDHIIPKSKGGLNNKKNYQLMCSKCNLKKDNKLSFTDIRKGHCKNKAKLVKNIIHTNITRKIISKKSRMLLNKFIGLYIKRPIKRTMKFVLRLRLMEIVK